MKPVSPPSLEGDSDHVNDDSIVVPTTFLELANTLGMKERSWSVPSQIPTDLSIQVDGMTFRVHKYPVVSKCGYITRNELRSSHSDSGYNHRLEKFPGGAATFETVLKFCYGLPLDLKPENIAPIRCAAEFLEMTEELEEGNLISKTESFITFVILASWQETITVLKSCESLTPWSENLQIVRRCCDAIAWKICRENTSEDEPPEATGLFDDLSSLRIDHFMRVTTTVRARGAKPEMIGQLIMHYAGRWLPGIDEELHGLRGLRKKELQFGIYRGQAHEEGINPGHKGQRTIVESLISILPSHPGAISCKFLLTMLKMALLYSASPALVSELEKRVGTTLEDASVKDLMIPNCRNEDQTTIFNRSSELGTMHNVDVIQRIVEYFLIHEQDQQQQLRNHGITNVSKLLDNYLAEIAKDPNLSITKFTVLAEALPESARKCDDGLYRAIDTFLKAHPTLQEHDKRRLCKIMSCEKLSLDACMHAAQNDRLPVRTIIQVLFSEQVKMRASMNRKEETSAQGDNLDEGRIQCYTDMEIKTLKAELENVKSKMSELQNDYSELQHDYEKLGNLSKKAHGWSIGWRKIRRSFQNKREGMEERERQPRGSSSRRMSNLRRRLSLSLMKSWN